MTPPHGSPAWALRRLRLAADLTQAQLAAELGVRVGTVHRWETAKTPVPWPVLERVATMASLDVAVVVGVGR